MTWGEFKRKMDEAGVKDEDYIGYIDTGGHMTLRIRKTSDEFGWEVVDAVRVEEG